MHNCPISLEKPNIPVLTNDGITYDFYSLAKHILTVGPHDPMTRSPITSITLIRGQEISVENIDIDETCHTFMHLVNSHPYLKIHGVGDLSFFQSQIAPVHRFYQSLRIHSFEPGITLFHLAAHLGNLECMKQLEKENIANINQGYKDNITPLHLACAAERPNIVKWLLSLKGIDVNCSQDSNGITPLHIAASKCNTPIVGLLAQHHDIDIKIPRIDGITPFEYAIHYHHLKILTILLLCSKFPSEGILYADQENDIELINMFLIYHLRALIHQPERMHQYLMDNPDVKACLHKYRDDLWDLLINPSQHLNLGIKFPHAFDENNFDQDAYFKYIEKQLENERKGICPPHPLFSIFCNRDIHSKINFFKVPLNTQAKKFNETEQHQGFKHSRSMPSLI